MFIKFKLMNSNEQLGFYAEINKLIYEYKWKYPNHTYIY